MKNIPDLQQVRFNKVVANGMVYVGLAGSDPIDNPVSVYTDYAGTNLVQTPIKLDYNSQAVIDGVVYSALYVDFAYSVQIVDADNVKLFTPTYISSDI